MEPTDINADTLTIFNSIVLEDDQRNTDVQFNNVDYGFITDFIPNAKQTKSLKEKYAPLNYRTLFSKKELLESTPEELITKQIMHYLEVYLLNEEGFFDIKMPSGTIVKMMFVIGIDREELQSKVQKICYANSPFKLTDTLKRIIQYYELDIDFNLIKNNEMRIALFKEHANKFTTGDDAVRYIIYKTTSSPLLIKDKATLDEVKEKSENVSSYFLALHAELLANVFNRHKKIILSLKSCEKNKTIINKISRLSKTKHIPMYEGINKRFISLALENKIDKTCLDKISIRDKFKYLNLLEGKKKDKKVSPYIIRNGKSFVKTNALSKVHSDEEIDAVKTMVLESLKKDLSYLNDKTIVIDDSVDYGLPISRKQTLGSLPFGTKVKCKGNISSGVYWRNEWGATDIDLSTIDTEGNRQGWGRYSTYDRNLSEISFSGDITNAPDGAMEFFTSKNDCKILYGLVANIFSGNNNCHIELVVGETKGKKWIDDVKIKEKCQLLSNQSLLGFVNGENFIVYSTRLNNKRISELGVSITSVLINKNIESLWTVKRLFDELNIKYQKKTKKDVDIDFDLTYSNFTYDKLESLFNLS